MGGKADAVNTARVHVRKGNPDLIPSCFEPIRKVGRTALPWAQILVLLCACLSSPAWSQNTTYEPAEDDSFFYEPEHFARYRLGDNGLQREDLLSLLSRQHAVIVLERPTDYRRRLVRELLQEPPEGLPPILSFRELPVEKANTFAIGYIQDEMAARRMTAQEDFGAFLVTFEYPLRMGGFLMALQMLADRSELDYVLPAFFFPDKMAAPFPLFEVEFLEPRLIPGGADRVKSLNRSNHVRPIQDNSENEPDYKQPVVMLLSKESPVNIMATVLRYQQMPGMVKNAQLRWLRLRMPVEVQASWDLPAGINSFGIWEPVRYELAIERDHDVDLLPKAFTEGAVRAWLADNTKLPDELIHVDDIDRQTSDIGNGRALDSVSLTFRLSKTGIYILEPYPIQAAYAGSNDQRRIEVFNAKGDNFLSIPGHLPRLVGRMPGQLLSVAALQTPGWITPTSMVLGILCIVVGLVSTLTASNLGRFFRSTDVGDGAEAHEQAVAALRQLYRGRLGDLTEQAESLSLRGEAEDRAWLRAMSVFLKQLLGESCYQDENRLLGGLGTSSETIRRYMAATSLDPEAAPVADALELLQTIENQSLSQELSLGKEDVNDLLHRATRFAESFSK